MTIKEQETVRWGSGEYLVLPSGRRARRAGERRLHTDEDCAYIRQSHRDPRPADKAEEDELEVCEQCRDDYTRKGMEADWGPYRALVEAGKQQAEERGEEYVSRP